MESNSHKSISTIHVDNRIEKFVKLGKEKGIRFNDKLSSHPSFTNPNLVADIKKVTGISDLNGTNISWLCNDNELSWVPNHEETIDGISEALNNWRKERDLEKRRRIDRGKGIEFIKSKEQIELNKQKGNDEEIDNNNNNNYKIKGILKS